MLEEISDEDAGKLFKSVLAYAEEGTVPCFDDAALRIAWKVIKAQVDSSLKHYSDQCERNRNNVNKRWSDSNEKPVVGNSDTTVYHRIPKIPIKVK